MNAAVLELKKLRLFRLILVSFAVSLASCSNLEFDPPKKEEKPVSVFTGKPGGISLEKYLNKKESSDATMPVNALLWRAALDIASFVPLRDVDTFGGSIITEWYQGSDQKDQRLKLAFFIIGLELRSDAIKVRAHIQKRQGNNWTDAGQDEKLARQLEDLVLVRARELRSALITESVK